MGNWNYDFFYDKDKDNLTEDDYADFEAHAGLMQDKQLKEMEREIKKETDKKGLK